jgi:Na+-driven multidrug efflux pump
MWAMLAASVGVYVPIALGSLALGLGIVGVWAGLVGLILVRLATCGWRFRGRRWAVVGTSRAPA